MTLPLSSHQSHAMRENTLPSMPTALTQIPVCSKKDQEIQDCSKFPAHKDHSSSSIRQPNSNISSAPITTQSTTNDDAMVRIPRNLLLRLVEQRQDAGAKPPATCCCTCICGRYEPSTVIVEQVYQKLGILGG
jgi:hypothetical protein